jgi:hypothetical protein
MAHKDCAQSDVLPKTQRGPVGNASSSDVQSLRSPSLSTISPMNPTINDALNDEPSRTPEEWIEFAQKKLRESDKPAAAVPFLAAQKPDLLEYLMTGTMKYEPGIGLFVKLINAVPFMQRIKKFEMSCTSLSAEARSQRHEPLGRTV